MANLVMVETMFDILDSSWLRCLVVQVVKLVEDQQVLLECIFKKKSR